MDPDRYSALNAGSGSVPNEYGSETLMLSGVVDPDTELFAQVGYGIIVPGPILTFMTRNSVEFFQFFLQNCSIGLCTGGEGRGVVHRYKVYLFTLYCWGGGGG